MTPRKPTIVERLSQVNRLAQDALEHRDATEPSIMVLALAVQDLSAIVEQMYAEQRRAANVASCLANGIQPD